ncbi:MAG: hypothetical protein R3281_05385 [Balneolaceae bacterium]|nr:hypothetical protein [Balneolaceae bacterium]
MKTAIIISIALLCWIKPLSATAQDGQGIRYQTVTINPYTERDPQNQFKSTKKAFTRAALHTLVPVALGYPLFNFTDQVSVSTAGGLMMAYGILLGPSMGNFYADDDERGQLGLNIRAGSAGFLAACSLFLVPDMFAGIFGSEDSIDYSGIKTVTYITGGVVAGSIVFNLATIPHSVNEYNRQVELDLRPGIQFIGNSSRMGPSVTLSLRF